MSDTDDVRGHPERDGSLVTTVLIGPGEDTLEYAERLRREKRYRDKRVKGFLDRELNGKTADVVDLDAYRKEHGR